MKTLTVRMFVDSFYYLATNTTTFTKKRQDDASSTNGAASDSINVDFSLLNIGQNEY